MAPVYQQGELSWSVVSTTCCHMAPIFSVVNLYNILFFYCFCPFPFSSAGFIKADGMYRWKSIAFAIHLDISDKVGGSNNDRIKYSVSCQG